ncbi:MAG: DUF1565 domain-containing protein [Nitrospirota bacterium]
MFGHNGKRWWAPIPMVVLLLGCGSVGGDQPSTAQVGVTMTIPSLETGAQAAPTANRMAPAPPSVATVRLVVTDAAGTELASATRTVTPGETVTIVLEGVPSGPARRVTATASDAQGAVLFQGQGGPVDLDPGVLTELTIQMTAVRVPTITITPPGAEVPTEATQAFTATVTGLSDVSVRWSVNGVEGGSDTFGRITQDNPATYTAPVEVPVEQPITITATAVADQTVSATVSLVVFSSSIILVAVDGVDGPACGTPSSPCRTITQGMSLALAGQTVVVAPGTYSFGGTGGEPAPLLMKAEAALVGGGSSITTLDFSAASAPGGGIVTADGAALAGFTIVGADSVPYLVEILNGTPLIASNVFADLAGGGRNCCGIGIRVAGTGTPVIANNTFGQGSDVLSTAILIEESAVPVVEANIIQGNTIGIHARGSATPTIQDNTIVGNFTGVQIDDSALADLGGGAGGSAGGNTLSCNTDADLVYNRNTGTVSARNNVWDHVPPTEAFIGAPSPPGIDILLGDASADTTGAALVTSPCNTTSTVTIALTGPSGTRIGGVDLSMDYDESLVAFSTAVASGAASGVEPVVNDDPSLTNRLVVVGLVAPNGFTIDGSPTEILTLTFQNVANGLPSEATYQPVTLIEVSDLSGAPITGVSASLTITNR